MKTLPFALLRLPLASEALREYLLQSGMKAPGEAIVSLDFPRKLH